MKARDERWVNDDQDAPPEQAASSPRPSPPLEEREKSSQRLMSYHGELPSPTGMSALSTENLETDYAEPLEPVHFDFGLKRRGFVQLLGAGLLIAASAAPALAQRGRRGGFGGSGARSVSARIHLGKDGSITVLTGKVEAGQERNGPS